MGVQTRPTGECLHETELELRNYKGKFSFSVVRPEQAVAFRAFGPHGVAGRHECAVSEETGANAACRMALSLAELGKKGLPSCPVLSVSPAGETSSRANPGGWQAYY